MPSSDESPWVRIGVLTRPHGVRGAVRLHLDNPDTDLVEVGLSLRLTGGRGPPRDVVITRTFGGGDRIELEGVSSHEGAEALRGKIVEVRREDFPDLDDNESYLVDLLGCEVFDAAGQSLGVIESFSDNGAQPLASVRQPSTSHLGRMRKGELIDVPFVPGIVVSVDENARRVVLDPPEGMFAGEALVLEEPPS